MSDWQGGKPPQDDDDFNLDWLGDSDEAPQSQSDDLGFEFDWEAGDEPALSATTSGRTGVTDQLYWLGTDDAEAPQDASDDFDFDFDSELNAQDEKISRDRESGIGQAQPRRLVQQRTEESIEAAENAEWGDTSELLDWMSDPELDLSAFGGAEPTQEPIVSEVPSWLREAKPSDFLGEEEAESAPDVDAEAMFRDLFGTDTGELTDPDIVKPVTDDLPYFSADAQFLEDPTASPDWLGKLGTDELDAINLDDFDEFELLPAQDDTPATSPEADFDLDLDALLSSFDDAPTLFDAQSSPSDLEAFFDPNEFDLSGIAELDGGDVAPAEMSDDFGALFADESDTSPEGAPLASSSDMLDFLRESQTQTGGISEILRNRPSRELDKLDERARELRELGQNLLTPEEATSAPQSSQLKSLLHDVPNMLDMATFSAQSAAPLVGGMVLTSEQTRRAEVLTRLVRGESVAEVRARRRSYPIGRVIMTALLIAVLVLPFFLRQTVVPNPPASFPPQGDRTVAFNAIDALQAGQVVLIATEYGGSAALELDDLTRALLTHLKSREAYPLFVSGNSLGLLRAEALAQETFPDGAYSIARYLPDAVMSLRDVVESPSLLQTGDNSLRLNSLNDLALIVVISDNADTLRAWMEQVKPNTRTPFILASGYSAQPLILPYARQSGVLGYFVSREDALTYRAVWDARYNAPTPTPTPTATNTPVPPTSTPRPTSTPVLPTATATQEGALVPTDTGMTNTPAPATATNTPAPATATSTRPAPSNTPAPATATTDDPLITVARVTASGNINVREAPSSASGTPIIGTLAPDAVVRVLSLTDARDWVQVVLPDNRVGWVASNLVQVSERRQSELIRPKPIPARYQQSTPEPRVLIGVLVVEGSVGVLETPSSSARVVGQLEGTAPVRVLEIRDEWSSVVLPDNRIGWVETFLLDVREVPQSTFEALSAPTSAPTAESTPTTASTEGTPAPTSTRPPATPTATRTLPAPTQTNTESAPTAESTPDPAPPSVAQDAPPAPPKANDGGARWQSQGLGLLAVLFLIIGGNLYYLTRHFLRGGRKPS
jgi:uncharacterized protein YgiM (DUF1202 family)